MAKVKEIRHVIMNVKTERFINWVNGAGTITYRKNPTLANYFIEDHLASNWMGKKNLSKDEFSVMTLEILK